MKATSEATPRHTATSKRRSDRRARQLALVAGLLMTGCGGVAQQVNAQQVADAQRERDALRVAYEAQQLRIKELSERIVALEDRVMLDVSPNQGSRGAGLWGRTQRGEQPRRLPVVKLSALNGRPRARSLSATDTPPSVQVMRAERLERQGRPQKEEEVPTLTAQNVESFKKRKQRSRSKRARTPYPPPKGAAEASSLGVVPVPPSPQEPRSQVTNSGRPPLPVISAPSALGSAPVALSTEADVGTASEQVRPSSPPQDPFTALLLSADGALASRDWAEAKRRYEQVLSLSPKASDRSRARLGVARVFKGKGRHREAIETLRALIQADPSGKQVPRALLEIGELQLQSGQVAQGRATLTRLKSLYPNTAAARRAEGILP